MSIGFLRSGKTVSVHQNLWLDRRILNFAHQGGAKEAPSSTMYAFRQALSNGANALEMDVHLTADRELVVCHDETIDRTTQLHGRIDELSLTELMHADNAYWWVPGHQTMADQPIESYRLRGAFPKDSSLGVARLDDVLAAFPSVFLNFDIKGGAIPYEQLLADCLRKHERSSDVIVASFHDDKLRKFRSLAPEIGTSTALQETMAIAQAFSLGHAPAIAQSVVALQIPYRFEPTDDPLFGSAFVAWLHDLGIAIHVWTIDEPDEMSEILDLGVDGIISDYPTVLEELLQRRQAPRPARF